MMDSLLQLNLFSFFYSTFLSLFPALLRVQ